MSDTHPTGTDDQRVATVVGFLRELTDCAMDHARIAGAKAKQQLQLEDPPEPPTRGSPKPTDYHALFIRYANLVRALVAVELRLAARPASPATHGDGLAGRAADPRRDKTMAWVDKLIKTSPDRTKLRRACADYLEQLLADPAFKPQPFGEILFSICKRFGLPWDVSKLPDEFLVPFPIAA